MVARRVSTKKMVAYKNHDLQMHLFCYCLESEQLQSLFGVGLHQLSCYHNACSCGGGDWLKLHARVDSNQFCSKQCSSHLNPARLLIYVWNDFNECVQIDHHFVSFSNYKAEQYLNQQATLPQEDRKNLSKPSASDSNPSTRNSKASPESSSKPSEPHSANMIYVCIALSIIAVGGDGTVLLYLLLNLSVRFTRSRLLNYHRLHYKDAVIIISAAGREIGKGMNFEGIAIV